MYIATALDLAGFWCKKTSKWGLLIKVVSSSNNRRANLKIPMPKLFFPATQKLEVDPIHEMEFTIDGFGLFCFDNYAELETYSGRIKVNKDKDNFAIVSYIISPTGDVKIDWNSFNYASEYLCVI